MSSNFSIEDYSSDWENDNSYDPYNYRNDLLNFLTVNITFAVAGTAINVWFLAAMLLCREIRSRMRNKLICGMLVVNLTESVILCGIVIFVISTTLLEAGHLLHCHVFTVYETIYHIQNFVGNWYIVILPCVLATQVMNFEPRFSRQWKNILTAVILISPGVFALFFVPLTIHSYYFSLHGAYCMSSTEETRVVYTCLDVLVPQILAILLLVMSAVLKRLRYSQGHSSHALYVQLIDDRSQMDPLYPFVALLVTAVASDICQVVFFMNPGYFYYLDHSPSFSYRMIMVFMVFAYQRLVVVPLVILLFADIRERIKTWRPCRRPVPPVDLVVTYEQNAL